MMALLKVPTLCPDFLCGAGFSMAFQLAKAGKMPMTKVRLISDLEIKSKKMLSAPPTNGLRLRQGGDDATWLCSWHQKFDWGKPT